MSIQRLTCSNQGVRLQSADRMTFEKPSYPPASMEKQLGSVPERA